MNEPQTPIANGYVVAFGNAFGGIELVGPFADSGDASLYAEGIVEQDWHVIAITHPDDGGVTD